MGSGVRVLAAVGALVASACAAPPPASPAPEPVPAPAGDYILREVAGRAMPADAGGRGPPGLLFASDGTVSGFTGCNRLFGQLANEPGKVFGPMGATKMACLDEDVARTESTMLAALNAAARLEADGGTLRLLSADGTVLAVFTSVSARPQMAPGRP